MKIKPGVQLKNISPQIVLAATICNSVYQENGYECVITSMSDGTHSNRSLHYFGDAVDLRIRNVPKNQWENLTNLLKEALGSEFDVVLESNHIHVEYDPR